MSAHEAIDAVPKDSLPNRAKLQSLLVSRYIYWVAATEDPADLDPRSEDLGDYIPVIFYAGSFYERDGDDSTTPPSDICLVTLDGSRYKITAYDILLGYSIEAADVTTPPDPDDVDEAERPVEGQAWRVPAGASGDWADKEDYIAIWTARSWAYVAPKIGRLIYNKATGGYEHINADGEWTNGVGNNPIANGVILPSMFTGGGGRVNWIVENQTTNTPPTAADGVNYVIGTSPTDRWTGHAGKIAAGENGDETIYEPSEGWTIYDKATDGRYNHDGSNWVSAFGNFTITRRVYTSSATWTKPARVFQVRVDVYGAGGGGGALGGNGGTGGTSSFGGYVSAPGGGPGLLSGSGDGSNGTGVGGEINLKGNNQVAPGPYGGVPGEKYGGPGIGSGAGGSGGYASKTFLASDLTSNVTVTVGAAGAGGSGGGGAGGAGVVIVEEYTFA